MIVFAPLAPLILPLATLAYALIWVSHRYQILYVGQTLITTEGQMYLPAVSHLFTAVYTLELCFLGLFVLGVIDTHSVHSILQSISMVVLLLITPAAQRRLPTLYRPLFEHGAIWARQELTACSNIVPERPVRNVGAYTRKLG